MKRALFTGAVIPAPSTWFQWTRRRRRWRHRLHGYLAIADAFIFFHLPPAFLHCFFVPASEISDPSALTQWRLAFANAAGEATRANAAIRANFIQLLLGWICLLAILARPRGLASIELARTGGGPWPVAERLWRKSCYPEDNSCASECSPLPPRS